MTFLFCQPPREPEKEVETKKVEKPIIKEKEYEKPKFEKEKEKAIKPPVKCVPQSF